MHILVGTITNKEPHILQAHLESVTEQRVKDGVSLDFVYIVDPDISGESLDVLDEYECMVVEAGEKPEDAKYAVSESGHDWTMPTFHWLAREKQRLLDMAVEHGYDAIWLCDSDLVCDTTTLHSLISAEREIVSAVFWTSWHSDSPPMPQVWMRHPYEMDGKGVEAHELISRLRHRDLIKVGGLGACTLIRTSALRKGVGFWPLVEGLPTGRMWQGEDRHFCVKANRRHVDLWADAWPDILHLYRPSDTKRLALFDRDRTKDAPDEGDLISIILEPLEEPPLANHRIHIRGRHGMMEILPAIEEAIASMNVGDDRFINVRFPLWWDIPQYRGQEKMMMVRLVDAKPYTLAPTLDSFEENDPFDVHFYR